MGWRFFKRIRLGFGLNANVSNGGIGYSWGVPGFRIGMSPNGRKYISIGIPGTGLYYQYYFKNTPAQGIHSTPPENNTPQISKWTDIK